MSAAAAPGVEAALANLTAVIGAARQQGTVDQEAEDLLHQAGDLAKTLQESPKDQDNNDSKDKEGGGGNGKGKGEDAVKEVAEVRRGSRLVRLARRDELTRCRLRPDGAASCIAIRWPIDGTEMDEPSGRAASYAGYG